MTFFIGSETVATFKKDRIFKYSFPYGGHSPLRARTGGEAERIITITCCTILSLDDGIPKGLSFPLALGIYSLLGRTSGGRGFKLERMIFKL